MTLSEFNENYDTVDSLLTFIIDEDIQFILDDIYSEDAFDEWIWERIRDYSGDWRDLARELDDYPSSSQTGYYLYDSYYGEFSPINYYTSDFNTLYDMIMDHYEFDPEDDEEDEDDENDFYEDQEDVEFYGEFYSEFDACALVNAGVTTLHTVDGESHLSETLKQIVN